MRILEVSRYKNEYAEHTLPFVKEQGEAIAKILRESQVYGVKCTVESGEWRAESEASAVEYFLVKGNYVTAVRELKKKIREFKPDIVHAHYGLSAITAELQSEVPVVTTFHNGETQSWWVNMLTSLMSLRAKHVIYVAPHIRDLVYFKAKKYSIIPCGVSLEDCFLMDKAEARKKLGWDSDKKYILFGGAFSNTRKNYTLLRDAIQQLVPFSSACSPSPSACSLYADATSQLVPFSSACSPSPSACSLYADAPSQLVPLSTNSTSNNSTKGTSCPSSGMDAFGNIVCVEMKGLTREECVLRMNACDVFALPTKNEGSPQALKEAMACNCPIVATDVADIKYLLGDMPGHYVLPNKKGNAAWWVGDEHSVEELAELIRQALAFNGRTKGRERIIELGYTNELVAKKIIEIYEGIIKK